MNIQDMVAILNRFQDIDDEKQMDEMIEVVDQLNKSPQCEVSEALFRIWERFPEDDGYETFWTILHVLEHTPHYETELLKSVARQPNEFNVLMINRMLNSHIQSIGEPDLRDLLKQVMEDERTPQSVRKDAQRYIERHKNQST